MLESLDESSKELVYLGLKKLIESAEGHGFHNSDQGHPVYLMSAVGKDNKDDTYADSPDSNELYLMLKEFCEERKHNNDTGYNWWYDFSTWQQFCKFAVNAHNKKHGIPKRY